MLIICQAEKRILREFVSSSPCIDFDGELGQFDTYLLLRDNISDYLLSITRVFLRMARSLNELKKKMRGSIGSGGAYLPIEYSHRAVAN